MNHTQTSINWMPTASTKPTQTMEFKKQLVTPSLAKQMLEANVKNRRVKTPVLLRYTQEMLNGRWKEDTGETIKISKSGIVLDGQHRLMAVVKSNMAISFHIVYNLNDDVFDVLDTGAVRNASDVFLIEGIKHDNILPSIISTYDILTKGITSTINGQNISKDRRLTNTQLKEMYYIRQSFWQSLGSQTMNWYNMFAKILTPSTIGGFYAFFYDINQDDAYQFMHQLCTGQDIKNNSIALLRTKLMQDKMDMRRIKASSKYAYIIKTWNLFRKKQEVKLIKFDHTNEKFPVAI